MNQPTGQALPPPEEPQENQRFFYRDDEVPADQLGDFGVIAPFARDAARGEGQVFRAEVELLEWVRGREQEQVVTSLHARLQRVRAIPEDVVDDVNRIGRRRRALERLTADITELAAEMGEQPDSGAVFARATDPQDPLEVPLFDPVSWFTSTASVGFLPFVDWLPMGGGFWRLAWFGWSNRPRSWRYSGWVWAFDGEFWSGASVLSGWFPLGFGPLAAWGMDRRVSSTIVL